MSQKKKGAAAWLKLSEKKQAAVLFRLRRQGGNYTHAANALEQLPELWKVIFSERTQQAEPAAEVSEELPELPPELVTYWLKLTARQQNNLLSLIRPLTADE